jgi:PAS domain S-box-containing protein
VSLEQLRSRIDRLLDQSADGLYGVDRQGRATLVTPSLMAMTGYSLDDVMGRAIHDVVHHSHENGAHYPRHECPIFMACCTGRVGHARETFWRKDGTSFPVEFATTPIIEGGEVMGESSCYAIWSDVVSSSASSTRRRGSGMRSPPLIRRPPPK